MAQPLYDLLARNPEFFAVRGTSLGETVLFASVVSLGAPLLLVAAMFVTSLLVGSWWRWLYAAIVTLLVGALVLNAVKTVPLPAASLAAVALLTGVLVAWALQKWAALQVWSKLLAVSAIVVPLIFFLRVPAATWGGGGGAATLEVPPPEHPVPVVVVVFDELALVSLLGPDGTIDAKSFPNFATLAEQATWYPLATTMSDFTTLAIPSLLSGRIALQHQQPSLADHRDNLFTLLAPYYKIVAQESLTRLCPSTVCTQYREPLFRRMRALCEDLGLAFLHIVLPATWGAKLPPVDQTWKDFGVRERAANTAQARDRRWHELFREQARGNRAADFLHFLSRIDERGSPTLYYYASYLPHIPFEYTPSGLLYSLDGDPVGMVKPGYWGDDEWAVLQDQQRHLLQVGFVDRQLGLLVRRLREVGLYDRALLVVTADHGVSFEPEGARRELQSMNFAEILAVPLFVKWPEQRRGRRNDRPVELVDVLPTILSTVGIDVPTEGRSLLSPATRDHQHRVAPRYRAQGTIVRFSSDELRSAIDEAVRRKVQRFGSEGFSTRFFQVGELGHMVGRPVSELGPVASSSFETELAFPADGAVFDRDQGMVPAHILGTSRPIRPGERPYFAIAINETVQAVTRTWKESPKHPQGGWSAVVDEAAFAQGTNRIEVFHVEPMLGGARLARTGGAEVSVAIAAPRRPPAAPGPAPAGRAPCPLDRGGQPPGAGSRGRPRRGRRRSPIA